MKKILICMLQLHKNTGSARTAYEQIAYFKSLGDEVHVASLTMDKDHLRSLGAIPHKLLPYFKSTGLGRRRWYNTQVERLKRKLSPDLVIGHGDIQNQDVMVLHNSVFLASELIHGRPLDPDHEMAQTHGPQLKEQRFKKLIANSELMKRDCIERFGIPADKIDVIYPGIDSGTFSPSHETKDELRKRFGFPDKVVVSLVTSGNFKKRGLDLFIRAIEELPSDIRKMASFRVLGKDDKNEFQRDFLTFDPPLGDVENYFRAIDVFVLPARIEEFGRVVAEAMSSGLPVITTDKVGAAELLKEDSSRFVLPAKDVSALKNAMKSLIERSELRSFLGELNQRLVRAVSTEKTREAFDRVFLSMR